MNGVLNAFALHGVQNEVGGIGGIAGNTFGGIGATPRAFCVHSVYTYIVMMRDVAAENCNNFVGVDFVVQI